MSCDWIWVPGLVGCQGEAARLVEGRVPPAAASRRDGALVELHLRQHKEYNAAPRISFSLRAEPAAFRIKQGGARRGCISFVSAFSSSLACTRAHPSSLEIAPRWLYMAPSADLSAHLGSSRVLLTEVQSMLGCATP